MPDEFEVVKSPPWAKSDFYLRRKRDRKAEVTKGELRTWIAFAEAGMTADGAEGYGPEGLPITATNIKEALTGKEYSEKEKIVLSDEILRKIRRAMLRKGVTMLELPSRFEVEVPMLPSE